jgi:hypothetical protein
MAKRQRSLTARGRRQIDLKNFALPGRRYPINDIRRARNALSRVAQHGTKAEQRKVHRAVCRKYPSIESCHD